MLTNCGEERTEKEREYTTTIQAGENVECGSVNGVYTCNSTAPKISEKPEEQTPTIIVVNSDDRYQRDDRYESAQNCTSDIQFGYKTFTEEFKCDNGMRCTARGTYVRRSYTNVVITYTHNPCTFIEALVRD